MAVVGTGWAGPCGLSALDPSESGTIWVRWGCPVGWLGASLVAWPGLVCGGPGVRRAREGAGPCGLSRSEREEPTPCSLVVGAGGFLVAVLVHQLHLKTFIQQTSVQHFAAMSLQSVAHFTARARDFGITVETLAKLKTKGFNTLGALAFSCAVMPGAEGVSAEVFNANLAVPVFGAEAVTEGHPEVPALRRLYFESWMATSADLKYRLERKEDEAPRPLPAVEREDRRKRLNTRLGPGLPGGIQGINEPAAHLIDEAAGMLEEQILKRLPLERCVSKVEAEDKVKVVNEMVPDKNGFLKMHTGIETPSIPVKGLMRLQACLLRRAVALDLGNVLTWEAHGQLSAEMLGALQRDPVPGFAQVTMEQAVDFDREVWRRMTEEARRGFRQGADGARPLDAVLGRVLVEPRVAMLLLPRALAPAAGAGSPAAPSTQDREHQLENRLAGLQRQMNQMASKRNLPPPPIGNDAPWCAGAAGSGAPGGKKKRKQGGGKGNRREWLKMPKELEGMRPKTGTGQSFCWAFNTGGCRNRVHNGRCDKGAHLCGGCLDENCKFVTCRRKAFQ